MSEKRFIFATNEKRFNLDDESRIWDNGTPMTALDIVMMLNEQQALISALHEENNSFKENQGKRRAILWWEHYEEKWANAEKELKKLKEENKQLQQKLDFYLLDEFEWKEKYGD